MSLTKAQQTAVEARGNVLVVAGAGTGKTKTLVERCLSLVLDEEPPVSIDEILMVTFTDAAAAEMRKRIRGRLEEEASGKRKQRCVEQLALLDSAFIGTIHSFCYSLIRQHFYDLEIDPQAAVMPKEESALLADETLDEILTAHYAAEGAMADSVRDLVRVQGEGSDDAIRKAILRLHHYSQTLHDPANWFERQIKVFESFDPALWRGLLMEAISEIRSEWVEQLEPLKGNPVAEQCLAAVLAMGEAATIGQAADALTAVLDAHEQCPRGKKTAFLKPLEKFREEVSFLLSLMPAGENPDPLAQDWQWSREPMVALLRTARQFTDAFDGTKRDQGVLDFHDLEQHALRLLWDAVEEKPTAIALAWQEKLRFVFVDEYQDINKAQDRIITALSRDGALANRFLVGDVKQSIYKFRLASPDIFRKYSNSWIPPSASTIHLSDNFRSREALLSFTNSIFGYLMKPEIGGIDYSSQSLNFGGALSRTQLGSTVDETPRTELHLRLKDAEPADEDEAGSSLVDMMEAEKEARLVGLRLLELMRNPQPLVWDEELKQSRPPVWGDIALLLRAPSSKAESYSKAFAQLGIPLQVARRGFYDTTEISDLLSLLQVLDNPLQDIPLIAVLHSPLANLSVNELAEIRLASRKTRFWLAFTLFCNSTGSKIEATQSATQTKARAFLSRFNRWRTLARQSSVSSCLETVLAETHYCEWLLVQDRGVQRHANVLRLVSLGREFDRFQRRGLMRFLAFLESQKNSDVEPAVTTAGQATAVTLMSVHQSKGLEFPVVVLPDLGKAWNTSDLRGRILLNEAYGLCSDIKPPHTRQRYPSLPLWLARRAERRELLGEELRLLYVAMTRARDLLILSASLSSKNLEAVWRTEPSTQSTFALGAKSWADWLGFWAAERDLLSEETHGRDALITWRIWDESELASVPQSSTSALAAAPEDSTPSATALVGKLSWVYPHRAVTTEPAKSSVSALRRRATDLEDVTSPQVARRNVFAAATTGKMTGAERGSAHHEFLHYLSLENPGQTAVLREEVARMRKDGILTVEQASVLDLEGIAAFWQSQQGKELLLNRESVQRELPFTARFSPGEAATLAGIAPGADLGGEFIVVQGVADLVAILPAEIWLFDFKTDKVNPADLAMKAGIYKPQMKIYSAALSRIYNRPVTRSHLFFIQARTSVAIDEKD